MSIGIPVYNGGASLEETLNSLLQQDYPNIEIVVSDNASSDDTGRIARAFAGRDGRVRYERTDALLPMYANWHRVMTLCRGPYFMWSAADDVRPRGAIRRLVEALQGNPSAVMAHGPIVVELVGVSTVERVGNDFPATDPDAAARVRAYVRGVRHPAMMHGLMRLEAAKACLLLDNPAQTRKGGPFGQDYIFNLRMVALGPVVNSDQPILVYRDRIWRGSAFDDPVGARAPWTAKNLFRAERIYRVKHWSLLRVGARELMRTPGRGFRHRRQAAAAFALEFVRVHARDLGRELAFEAGYLLSSPLARLRGMIGKETPRHS